MLDVEPSSSLDAPPASIEIRTRNRGAGTHSAAVLVLGALLAGACAAGGTAEPTSGQPGTAPTAEELGFATYEGILSTPVTLAHGLWEGPPSVEGGAARPAVGLVRHFVLEGDLDGDGDPEAAALLWESSGGSGTRSYLAVVKRDGAELRNLGTALVGDRTQVMAGVVADGRIALRLVEAGPGEAACCPTRIAAAEWALTDEGLHRVATEIVGTLSLAELEGLPWRLRELGWERSVPDGVEITIAFEGDRVAGHGGCNDFFGSVSSKAPGELAFSATGTTMRACPEPAMGLEQRYLAALAAASTYRFNGGRLVLGSTTDEGPVVLVFARVAERR
jgi:heat shock protein HslJ